MRKSRQIKKRIAELLLAALLLPLPVFAVDSDLSEPVQAPADTSDMTETAAEDAAEPMEPAKPGISFNESAYRTLKSRTVKPKRIKKVNLRTMLKESNRGYAVVQGSCTDGKYAYYIMVSSKTQKGRILKVRMKGNRVVKRSKVLKTWHANGMAYDSKRKVLVTNSRGRRCQELTVIDAKTLKVVRQQNVKYSYYKGAGNDSINAEHQKQGIAAIAYVKKYDCYIALERVYHNLLLFDPDTFQCIGMIRTNIPDKYPGTYQAMDADEKYVYLLLSKFKQKPKKQPYNVILALDWNSENLLPAINAGTGEPVFIRESWACRNNGSGRPDAVIKLNSKNEAESIYHTTDKKGREHFYLAEYYTRGSGKHRRRNSYVYDLGII